MTLDEYRRKRGWSYRRLAQEIGTNANAVWRWCNGHAPRTAAVAMRVADALGDEVSAAELLGAPAPAPAGTSQEAPA